MFNPTRTTFGFFNNSGWKSADILPVKHCKIAGICGGVGWNSKGKRVNDPGLIGLIGKKETKYL